MLMFYAKANEWDHERFIADFESSTCYHPPLSLVDGRAGTFLKTTFEWKGDRFSYKLKNDNEIGQEPTIWRYKDFRSHAPLLRAEESVDRRALAARRDVEASLDAAAAQREAAARCRKVCTARAITERARSSQTEVAAD